MHIVAFGRHFAVVLVGTEEARAASTVGKENQPEERRMLPELVDDDLTACVVEYLRGLMSAKLLRPSGASVKV